MLACSYFLSPLSNHSICKLGSFQFPATTTAHSSLFTARHACYNGFLSALFLHLGSWTIPLGHRFRLLLITSTPFSLLYRQPLNHEPVPGPYGTLPPFPTTTRSTMTVILELFNWGFHPLHTNLHPIATTYNYTWSRMLPLTATYLIKILLAGI
jgi:hypothetical protein